MSFLTPLYILGLGAISLPFVLHLIRRQPKSRIPFSTIMFLKPSLPRMSRRSRIENWLLLLLRMTAICLAAFAFSRPFLRSEHWNLTTDGEGETVAILLDTSASMKRGDLWKQALAKVEGTIASAKSNDRIGIFTFDSEMKSVIDFKEWDALAPDARSQVVVEQLKAISPSWAATNLKSALAMGIEKLETEQESSKESLEKQNSKNRLLVISDFQKGNRIESWDADAWPAQIELQLVHLEDASTTNAGLHLLSVKRKPDDSSIVQVRLKVTNAENSRKNSFALHWKSLSGREKTIFVSVEPGMSRTVVVELKSHKLVDAPDSSGVKTVGMETAFSIAPVKFTLVGDDHPFDNEVIAFEPKTERVRVLYYGDEDEDDAKEMRHFLGKAYLPTPKRHIDLISQDDDSPAVLSDSSQAPIRMAVVTRKLASPHLNAMKDYLTRGGTMLVVLKNESTVEALAALLDRTQITASNQQPDQELLLQEIDFDHFLFQPFDFPEFSDFSKIFIWKYRKIDAGKIPHAKILARYDNGDPAILEIPQGRGRIIVLTTSWRLEDSQLALSSKFAPLLNRLLEFDRPTLDTNKRYEVGEPVFLPQHIADSGEERRTVVTTPTQERITLVNGQQEFRNTNHPGVYSFVSTQNEFVVQVHRPEEESDTAPLELETFDALGLPVSASVKKEETLAKVERKRQLMSRELENDQQLWWWLILFTVLLLLLETWVAGRRKLMESN